MLGTGVRFPRTQRKREVILRFGRPSPAREDLGDTASGVGRGASGDAGHGVQPSHPAGGCGSGGGCGGVGGVAAAIVAVASLTTAVLILVVSPTESGLAAAGAVATAGFALAGRLERPAPLTVGAPLVTAAGSALAYGEPAALAARHLSKVVLLVTLSVACRKRLQGWAVKASRPWVASFVSRTRTSRPVHATSTH